MLVLTRKKDETIVLDGRITVKVLQVKGSTIRIGIDAPREIPVRRGELQPIAETAGDSDEPPQIELVAMAS